ncbi:dynein regulatory complex protein 1 [Osmia lignaria lignaria]|uniref:dynein regulatory complex protein 1 n=1 Tax=Osmia lignaria lignaria TaxID=1437193 RepID=UPI0014785BA2|nr:dynein regulatory complex protein 1 [Osmia lignaria]
MIPRKAYSETTQLEDEEPSILSSDPNERKLARRLRINRRREAQIRKTKALDEEIIEETPIEKQILDGIEALEQLASEGDEVVCGVRVACDAKELQRRKEMKETRERLLKMLEEEDKNCMQKYREITEKWPSIVASKDPLDIHNELEAQNVKCNEILEKKDALIAQLKQELENADIKYEEDVKNQNADIDLLIERMENQARTMAKAYRYELNLIENVIDSERKIAIKASTEKWETLYKKLQDDTVEAREQKKLITREYEEAMKKAIIEHQEEYRKQKISFEMEIQNLQQQIQTMKTACLMNVEKLDYNYTVLKHREEENLIVKNQQKRRINKLQDVLNDLKKTYAGLEESTRLEIQKLTNQILKVHKAIQELEEKSDQLAIINDTKYMQIWDLNIETANQLVDKILSADRIIHEQLLGVEWQPPEEQLLKKEDLVSYCGAMCAIKQKKEEAKNRKMISKSYKPPITLEEINLERSLLNHIAKLISNHCDYMIEYTLKDLLSDYTEDDKLLIRLDKIFDALKITSEQQLQFLLNFFLPYAHCPICKAKNIPRVCGVSSETTESSSSTSTLPDVCGSTELNEEEGKLVAAMEGAFCCDKSQNDDNTIVTSSCTPESSSSTETLPENGQIVSTCVGEGVVEVIDASGKPKRQLVCDKGHLLVIETEFVSNALKDFVKRYEFVKQDEASSDDSKILKEKETVSRNITDEDIIMFWDRYRDMFSEDRERLWDNLFVGLKKYYDILKERHELNVETESLRRQNSELRRLLEKYETEMALNDE